jgi:hypothetical protein
MRNRFTFMKKRWLVTAVSLAALTALVGVALAYFTSSGTGAAQASVGSLGASTLGATPETPGAGQITLSWTAVNQPASVGTVRYYVKRLSGSVGGNCPSSAATATTVLTCHDDSLAAGSYSYQLVTVWQGWTSTSNTAQTSLNYGPADHLNITAPSLSTAGNPFDVTVTAKDSAGNTVSGYSGSIHFTSSDGSASLPADYTFTGGDGGSHFFSTGVTLKTAGTQSLTATDKNQNSLSGSANVLVSAGAASKLVFTSSAVSGAASSTANVGPITVQEQDPYGNPSTTSETITLSSSSSHGTFSATQNGTATTSLPIGGTSSNATFYYGDTQSGSPTLTASGSAGGTPTQAETINAASATNLVFTSQPVSGAASTLASLGPITLQEQDQFGNPSMTALTVNLSSSSSAGTFASSASGNSTTSINIGGNSSSGSFYYGDQKAGSPTVTAAATGVTSATQKEAVSPATATVIGVVSGSPQSANAGTAFGAPLVALVTDTYGNPVPGVAVSFTAPSSGASATFASSGCTSNSPATTCVVTTDANGRATSSTLTANTTTGPYSISASATSTNSVNFAMTNTGTNTLSFVAGVHTVTVPAHVTSVRFTLIGAGGGGGFAGALGGAGASLQGTMTLPDSSSATGITVDVGAGGASTTGGGLGGNGFGNGGQGGDPTQDGGGGGGGTAVYIVSTSPIAVAGGGGGGGGNGSDSAAGVGGAGTGGLMQNPGTSTAGSGGNDGTTHGGAGGVVTTTGSASPFSYTLALGAGGTGGVAGSPATTSGGLCIGGIGASSKDNGNAGGGGGGGGGLACGGGGAAGPSGISGGGGGGGAGYSGGSLGSNVDVTVSQISTGSSGGNSLTAGVDGSATFTGSGITGS